MILHKKTSPESIIEAISNVSGYSVSDLKGFTLVEVGKLFNRHFSTVIMAEKKVDQYKNTISDSLEAVEQHVKRYEDSRGTT
mgnify:CR=1 FL=1